jgi:putative membrane protein
MLWVKAFHIIFMTAWFAGLFYLPRLFVHHALTEDKSTRERLKIMERKLFFFVLPWAILTLAFGVWMLMAYAWQAYSHSLWLHLKLLLVVILVAYYAYCGKLMLDFQHDRNQRSHVFYRWFNEVSVVLLFAIIILVVVKPF